MLPEARRIKPRFLYHPLREIATYESILAPLRISAPQFYGSAIDQLARPLLALPRAGARSATDRSRRFRRVAAGQRVAGADALPASRASLRLARAAAAVPLVQYDRVRAQLWIERARAHLTARRAGTAIAPQRFAWLASRYEAVVEEIAALPTGFVHGEFFASNVLVETAAGTVRVRPLDWELAGIGPLLIDLAALTAGTLDRRRADRAGDELSRRAQPAEPRHGFRTTPSCARSTAAACSSPCSASDGRNSGRRRQHIRRTGSAKRFTPPTGSGSETWCEAQTV